MWGEEEENGGKGSKGGLCGEEPHGVGQPIVWAEKFRTEDGVCQPYTVIGRD